MNINKGEIRARTRSFQKAVTAVVKGHPAGRTGVEDFAGTRAAGGAWWSPSEA